MKIQKETVVKLVGVGGMVLTGIATLLSNYSNEQRMIQTVEEKVAKALADKK